MTVLAMASRRKAIAIILGALGVFGAIYGVYKWNYPTYAYRYRMTVEVEVDGQMKTGSGVIEGWVSRQPQFLPDVSLIQTGDRGDAVFVDLGDNRNLVALLAQGTFAEHAGFFSAIVPRHFQIKLLDFRQLAMLPGVRGKWSLAPNDLPTLVTFSNLADPATVRTVRPDQFEQVFGQNVHWRGITIEMTTDAISWAIVEKLPWASRLIPRGGFIHPNRFTLNGSYLRRS